MDYMGPVPFESDKQTLGAALLTPTKIYVKAVSPPTSRVRQGLSPSVRDLCQPVLFFRFLV